MRTSGHDDGEVIAASLDEPAGFAEIFDRHVDPVHRFVSYRVGASDVDDVVAEVFRSAFEQRSTFRSSADSAKPWLLGIASNLTKRHHRSTARRRALDVRDAQRVVTPIDPLLAVEFGTFGIGDQVDIVLRSKLDGSEVDRFTVDLASR